MCVYASGAEHIVRLETLSGSEYVIQNNDVLTGTLQTPIQIVTVPYITFTLRNATIEGVNKEQYDFPGMLIVGNGVTMILEGQNYIKGHYKMFPGIMVDDHSSLTIKGDGRLYAYSNGEGAGIGAGRSYTHYTNFQQTEHVDYTLNCGNITIDGGEIYAVGAGTSPGIGACPYEYCGYVHITSNVKKVVATKGSNANYYIGGTGVRAYAGCDVVVGGKTYEDLYIPAVSGQNSYTYIPWTGNLAQLTDDAEVKDGSTITGNLTQLRKITIPDGAHIKLENANINLAGTTLDNTPFGGLNCNGDATIEVTGPEINTVCGFGKGYPAIHVPAGKTLHLIGDGALKAYGALWGAGIGGGSAVDCGNIHIGGALNIYAKGGCDYAAGIGGGYNKKNGTITIDNTVRRVKVETCESASCTVGAGYGSGALQQGKIYVGGRTYNGCIDDNPFIYLGSNQQGIEETPSNSPSRGEKILRDGQLFILVGDKMYDARGARLQPQNANYVKTI